MWLCLLVVCISSSVVVCGDKLFPVSYYVREPNSFKATFNVTKVKYSLLDSEYPKHMISNGYMSGGQGKLTDGIVGQALLPDHDVTAENSSWVAWVFRGTDEKKDRNLSIYFQFDEDVLIESISVNILSQQITETVATYVYTTGLVQLLQEDNSTVVGSLNVSPTSRRNPGIRKENFKLDSCQPARIVRIEFLAGETRRLVFGEIQFEGEPAWMDFPVIGHPKPGTRLVLTCFSNKANVTIYRNGKKVDCDVTRTAENRYNCTVTKERFGFTDGANYVCVAYPPNGRCQSQPLSKSMHILPNTGIYADVLERRVSLSSMTTLNCHSQNLIAEISFQKSDGGTTVNIVDSLTHTLSINITSSVSMTTLIFLNVSKTDAGVYRCRVVKKGTTDEYFSQNMTLSVSYGGITDPHTVPTDGPLHTSPSTQVSTMKSSGRPFSSSSGHTPASVVPPGSSGGGLGGGAIGGIVFAFLFIILVVVAVILYVIWRSRRPKKLEMVEGVRYDKNASEVEPAYDTPEGLVHYAQSPYTGRPDTAPTSTHNGDSPMPPQVSAHRFAQQQVNQSPDYAEAAEVVRPKAKTMPSLAVKPLEETDDMRNRQASMPPKLGVSRLIACQKVNDSVDYSEPSVDNKSKTRLGSASERHISRDSGLGHDNDSSPTHLYERVEQQATNGDAILRHRAVADLAIYASLDEIRRHSQILSGQSDIKHEEDLSPEYILSFNEASPLSPTSAASVLPYLSVYADPAPLLQEEGPLEMSQDKFSQHRRIGQGQFGDVFHAFARSVLVEDVTDGRLNGLCVKDMPVALKCLREGASKDMEEAFNKEVKFMAPLRHEHVVRLLGVCSMAEPRFMVIEYMENGDLHQYLQQFQLDEQSLIEGQELISYGVLVSMAADVAAGMEYLASKFFIHRDLATRNCLVGQNHMVKIADFGMTRSVYEKNYYRLAGRAILPIRWMAPESFYGKFTMMSDIWAYGVTCWEIFTLARMQPLEEMEDKDVIENAVRREGRQLLERPACCDDPTFHLMMECWSATPESRPSFTIICNRLRRLAEEHEG